MLRRPSESKKPRRQLLQKSRLLDLLLLCVRAFRRVVSYGSLVAARYVRMSKVGALQKCLYPLVATA